MIFILKIISLHISIKNKTPYKSSTEHLICNHFLKILKNTIDQIRIILILAKMRRLRCLKSN
jgi:hypothetical protein